MPDPEYAALATPEPLDDPEENVERLLVDAQRDHTFGVIDALLTAMRDRRINPVRGLFLIENEARMARRHFAELDPGSPGGGGDDDDDDFGANYGGNRGDYGRRRVGIRRAGRGALAALAGAPRRMAHGNEEFRQMMPALQKQADAAMIGKTEERIRSLTNALGDARQMRLDALKLDPNAGVVVEDALIARIQGRLNALLDESEPVADPTYPVDGEPCVLAPAPDNNRPHFDVYAVDPQE